MDFGTAMAYTAILHAIKWHGGCVRGSLPILLRAGAEISDHVRGAFDDDFIGPSDDIIADDPAGNDFVEGIRLYIQKVVDAGGWKKFEQAHLATLTKTFAPKFPMLPPEMVRHILTFGFHAGFY